MDLGIQGRRAIVTAASRGIGESTAINLSKEGVSITVIARTETDLKEVMNKLSGTGHYMIVKDLTEEGAPEEVMEELKHNFGLPDILINNLGSDLNIKEPLCPIEDWRKVYRINFEVTVEMSRLVIPFMKKKKWGRIVNISSTASMENNGPVPYCSMKAALTAYSRSMGRVLSKMGIVMSAILPGVIVTKGGYWEKVLKERPEHAEKYKAERCPSGEFGEPDDIGTMVALLCSEQAKFCQGSIFPVDGGQSKHYFNISGF